MQASEYKFETEIELAAVVVDWLEKNGWDVYQEVQHSRGGPVCDIVAVKMKDVWTISCKKALSLAVILQADYWRSYKFSNFSSIAVPTPVRSKAYRSNPLRGHYAAVGLLKKLGLGMIAVAKHANFKYGAKETQGEDAEFRYEVDNSCQSPYQPTTEKCSIMRVLRDEHKTFAKAGTAGGGHYTPFRGTVVKLEAYVAAHPGCSMKEAVNNIQHHYSSDKTAVSSLLTYIQRGVIAKIQLVHSGKGYKLYTHEQYEAHRQQKI